jgi:hypothetical protein
MKACIADRFAIVAMMFAISLMITAPAQSESKAEKVFAAVITDTEGIETEVKNVVFYWEEKLSETSFVPHELRHLPVKRGSVTNNIPFDRIKQVEAKPSGNEGVTVVVMLANGKTGEFVLTIPGSFRGESDFGQADVPVKAVKKVVFK